jgi:hypothetical protein
MQPSTRALEEETDERDLGIGLGLERLREEEEFYSTLDHK